MPLSTYLTCNASSSEDRTGVQSCFVAKIRNPRPLCAIGLLHFLHFRNRSKLIIRPRSLDFVYLSLLRPRQRAAILKSAYGVDTGCLAPFHGSHIRVRRALAGA